MLDALGEVPKLLNISRRRFLTTSAGLAASFVALNEVFKDYAFGEALFRVAKDGGFDHDAFLADGPPSELFVFDDQCHLVRGGDAGAVMGHMAGPSLRATEYDDRLPNEPPVQQDSSPVASPYGVAAANRGDRLEELRAEYRQEAETRFGTPRSNQRDGWVRVR